MLLGAGAKVEDRHILAGCASLQRQGKTKQEILESVVGLLDASSIENRFTVERRLQLNEIEYRREMSNILRTDIGFTHTVSEEHFYEIRSNTNSAVKKYADIRMCIPDINHVWIFELKKYTGRCHDIIPRFKHKEQLYMYLLMERMIQEEQSTRMKVHGVLIYYCNNGVSYWYMQDHRYRMKNIQSIDRIDFDLN